MHYNWQRYYNPGQGRYITQDPIGLAGGLNPYSYVMNNPVQWIDPLGLA
ncbi:RHS repeat-associated core domain-containing protein, partial [Escherichia coli]|nr:RHS repeat-associated core domain-containing protein [Escherichia coli]